jgi:hypothetical protein
MNNDYKWTFNYTKKTLELRPGGCSRCMSVWIWGGRSGLSWLGLFAFMLLRSGTCTCGRNIAPLFRIAAAKFQTAKFRALRPQLRSLPSLFITLVLSCLVDRACTFLCEVAWRWLNVLTYCWIFYEPSCALHGRLGVLSGVLYLAWGFAWLETSSWIQSRLCFKGESLALVDDFIFELQIASCLLWLRWLIDQCFVWIVLYVLLDLTSKLAVICHMQLGIDRDFEMCLFCEDACVGPAEATHRHCSVELFF